MLRRPLRSAALAGLLALAALPDAASAITDGGCVSVPGAAPVCGDALETLQRRIWERFGLPEGLAEQMTDQAARPAPGDPGMAPVILAPSFDAGEIVAELGGPPASFDAATRLFGAPDDFPPKDYGGYGIVAWRTEHTASDHETRMNVCRSFERTFVRTGWSSVPKARQLVTVWPVDSVESRDGIRRLGGAAANRDERCARALDAYGLDAADGAFRDLRTGAPELHARLSARAGPFLMAWNPADRKGEADAAILVFDMSAVRTEESARAWFTVWKEEIVNRQGEWADEEVSVSFVQNVRTRVTNAGLMASSVFLVGKAYGAVE